jgi:hypothetical protein
MRRDYVVLARLREEFASPGCPREVHAYSVPGGGEVAVLTAPCGNRLKPGRGERVEMFDGVPCSPCLLLSLDAGGSASMIEESPAGTGKTVPSGRFAVGLRGDQVQHIVDDVAVRGSLDGRSVVLTLCGNLGWGPLATAPGHWPVCAECAGIAGAVL